MLFPTIKSRCTILLCGPGSPPHPIQTDVIFQLRWAKWINNRIVTTTGFTWCKNRLKRKKFKNGKVECFWSPLSRVGQSQSYTTSRCLTDMESPLILNHHILIYWYRVGVSDWYGITTQFICAANLSQLRLKTETDDWHFVSSFDQKRVWILFFVTLFYAGRMPGAESIHFKCKRCYSGCKNDASDVFHLKSSSGCNKESISCWVLSLTQGCPPWSIYQNWKGSLRRKVNWTAGVN